ncbi:MAG: murB [Bacteroidota bacterium]|jgi:UDP-N-acetylmuramate dehydrogenase|nr:murB [Bacteroidota bacterium]
MTIRENISLKKFNTFGIDASARYYAEVSSLEEIKETLSDSKLGMPRKMILGGGSNLLFTKDFDGLIIKNNLKGIEVVNEDDEHFYVRSAAGEVWHEFVMHCIENNYAGIENLSLIPGNVGASPMQNIGAYGVEIKDSFHELQAFHINDKALHVFTNNDCKFGYRESVFKRDLKDQFIITSVTFKLRKTPVLNTSYGAIEKELDAMGVTSPTIHSVSKAVCNIRSSKLPDPKVIGNAGSFFKNPVISAKKHNELKAKFPEMVSYTAAFSPDGKSGEEYKLAAGWLIEQCGWKGKTLGDAGVHKLQALVLVNYGNAKGSEIYDLSTKILESVKKKFGVDLEREVNIV